MSHKSEDEGIAEIVAETIAQCGLAAYLDVWDPNVDGDEPELVDYISSVIGCCESLIAVVSHHTVRSWWVPLEIGVAITKDLPLGTFSSYTENLPSYLYKWPVLRDMEDLENWCKEHKRKKGKPTQKFYESLRSLFKTPFFLGFDVGVLTEHLQVSPKNPERKVSDEHAIFEPIERPKS